MTRYERQGPRPIPIEDPGQQSRSLCQLVQIARSSACVPCADSKSARLEIHIYERLAHNRAKSLLGGLLLCWINIQVEGRGLCLRP